ncbi:MAG: macrolide ABC transporter ATP-binding protein [Peptococcaceae bacterium BRH_c4a]|nr:MAG: macrolide ABC transporter ATP-binding protein [Peptococcaceae bacterium BRH_c4a]
MEPQPVIQIENIRKTYFMLAGQVNALKGVTISVTRGEMVAVMGPSGSGKSTLLNIIGYLDRTSEGSYLLDGIDVSGMSRDQLAAIRNRKIGFIFQGFNLLSRTSALVNVQLPLLYAAEGPAAKKELDRRALEALSWVGLDKYSHPGGQQQRVAIARALVNNPSLILADEPTGALDTRTSLEVIDVIQKLNKEKNITVVMVTHEPQIARYCQRIIRVRDGRIQENEKVDSPGVAARDLKEMPEVED